MRCTLSVGQNQHLEFGAAEVLATAYGKVTEEKPENMESVIIKPEKGIELILRKRLSVRRLSDAYLKRGI